MSIFEILMISFGLAMDCFAVSVSCSMGKNCIKKNQILQVSFFFGLFQALMPLLGWAAGLSFKKFISDYDHWVAFVLLGAIGFKMIIEAFKSENKKIASITKLWIMLGIAVATSIDALIVGIGFAFLDLKIFVTIATIGVITFLVSLLGFFIGRRFNFINSKTAEITGGIILIGIGLKILIEHLYF